MKRQLLMLILISLAATFTYAQNDTVRHVIFTEWRGDAETHAYAEITNVGDSAVDLSRFTLNGMYPWSNAVNASSQAHMHTRLEGILQPGESFVIVNVSDRLTDFEEWNQRPHTKQGLIEAAEQKGLIINRLENEIFGEQGLVDDVSWDKYWALRLWNGAYASTLWYNFDDGIRDSVIVDNVNLLFSEVGDYPFARLYPENWEGHNVAGVFEATDDHILVRKANITTGTPWDQWDIARGVDMEDSEWILLPENEGDNPGGATFNTVGNHGDFQLDFATSAYSLDEGTKVITVPWGTQRGDSIILDDDAFALGDGMAWEYVLNSVYEDSAMTVCVTGDTLRLFAAGNERYQVDFRIEVADPTGDMVEVFRKIHANADEEDEYFGTYEEGTYIPYYVTEDDPVIDTIGNVPFATRVDSLMAYLSVAPNATTAFVWVDGVDRVDMKDGDKLVVTGGDGSTTREYYISVEEYEKGEEGRLAYITWPDKPAFVEGWFTGDTIPGFSPSRISYQLKLPLGTTNIPSLAFRPMDLNATVSSESAKTLKGNVADRTTTITVTSEDDSIVYVYNIIFDVEKDYSDQQNLITDPIISQLGEQIIFNNGFIEVANPGTVELDLSNYMFISGTGLDPVSAITSTANGADSGSFNYRYKKYVPGYRYTDNVTDWIASPGLLVSDATVDPYVPAGETFLMVGAGPSGAEVRQDWELYDRADMFWGVLEGMENEWDMLFAHWTVVPKIWRNNVVYMYKILNDSILDGTKGTIDPADFILVDAFGSSDGSIWEVAGRTVGNDSWTFERKPHIYQGNKTVSEMIASNGTNADDSEWIATTFGDNPGGWPNNHLMLRDGAGAHAFDLITGYLSTVSSKYYNVSPGFDGDQSITGDISGTLDDFLSVIFKADEGQILSLHSNVDGSEKSGTDDIVANDTLVSVSSDGINTTRYVLVNQPLSDDALLTSETFTVEVTEETGTVSGMEFGATIASVLENVDHHSLATLNVVDAEGVLIPLTVLTFDTTYTDALVGDAVYFQVIAEDHMTIITYHLMPNVSASDAYVISSVYNVEQEFMKIHGIPLGTSVPSFMGNIIPVAGAVVTVVDKVEQPRAEGVMAYDDMLKVVSEDGTVTVMYHLEFQDETTTLANSAPNVSVSNESISLAVSEAGSIGVSASDDGIPGPLSYSWSVTSGDAANVSIANADQATTDVTISVEGEYTLQVDVSDGDLTTSASVIVTVTGVGIEEMGTGSMKLYPNPVTDKITVELPGMAHASAILKIYSITGAAVFNAELVQLRTEIDLGSLDKGLYLITVDTGDEVLFNKIQILK